MAIKRPNLSRERALEALLEVVGAGTTLDAALESVWPTAGPYKGETRDRALTQALAFGVLRWFERLRAIAAELLEQRPKERDLDVELALLIGLYQLDYMRTPPHAAVSSSVDLAHFRRKRWASGLINGCLRRYQREHEQVLAKVDTKSQAAHAHPLWLAKLVRVHWAEQSDAVLTAAQERAPMTLRVNLRKGSRDDYLGRLMAADINATPCEFSPAGLRLETPVPVEALPGFAQGAVSVQDEAAQLAAILLDPAPATRILDACAAPGGKSAHLLESQRSLASMVCLDPSKTRLDRMRINLERLELAQQATLVQGNAEAADQWWDGKGFDSILVDAPCTATGVIRRHPDIKLLRRESDIAASAATQAAILSALWPLLVPGGRLLYATCSILPPENDDVIEGLLGAFGDASVVRIDKPWGQPSRFGRQVLPGSNDMDGFYYALVAKSAS